MTRVTKKRLGEIVLNAGSGLACSFVLWLLAMNNLSVTRAAEDKARDSKIGAVEANQATMGEKIDKIAEDVAFIRGKLSK